MAEDYRNTKYCSPLMDVCNKKNAVRDSVLTKHPRAKDMHAYISRNDEPYKQKFIEAYNGKCAYCGVSNEIIPWKMFEIDHVIPKESSRFGGSKAKAGYIENLALSCYYCNRGKQDFECTDEEYHKVHPDYTDILDSFIRDDEYYIRISDRMKDDETVKLFYDMTDLGNQIHRLDYLLLNMRGLYKKIGDKHPAHEKLMAAIDLLQQKRNVMR